MQKNFFNFTELLIIVWIILVIIGFYHDSNSFSRFSTKSYSLRIGMDIFIIVFLIFRAIHIIKYLNRKYSEIGNIKILEKVTYGCCLISLLPDLSTWYQWNYFANLYQYIFILFNLPIILWTVEIVERISVKNNKNKIIYYGLSILLCTTLIVGYTIYLSHTK